MVLAALAVFASAGADELKEIRHHLQFSHWTVRMSAVHHLEPHRIEGLPLLEYAARDADWRVRLTAVHYLSHVGPAAIPSMVSLMREEPCRYIRLTAVHRLGSMGEPAIEALKLGLDDESSMVRHENRYWLAKLGAAASEDPDLTALGEARAAAREDLSACGQSETPGRRPSSMPVPAEAAPEVDPFDSLPLPKDPLLAEKPAPLPEKPRPRAPRPSKAARLAAKRALADLDRLFTEPSLPARRPPPPSDAEIFSPDPRVSPVAGILQPLGLKERLPPGLPGPQPTPRDSVEALRMKDAGAPRAGGDPVPALSALLKDSDPLKRARAADELARLGPRAAPAVKPLGALLSDPDPDVRASAALALGNLGPASDGAVRRLVKALSDPSADVQSSAALALGRIGTPKADKAFRRHIRDSSRKLLKKQRPD